MTELYWAIGIFGSAFFGLILFAIIYKMLEVRAARSWLPTPGKVVDSRVVARKKKPGDIGYNESSEGNVANYAFVQYEYTVNGKTHRCDRVSIADHGANDEVELTLERYPVGTDVTVYYNPKNPKQAVIEREMPAGIGYGIILLLALFGGGPLILLFATTNAAKWIEPFVANKDRIPVVLLLAGMGTMTTLMGIASLRQVYDAYAWQSTTGEIVSSKTEKYRSYFGEAHAPTTLHRPSIVYMYEVGGRRYAGDRVSFGGVVSASHAKLFNGKLGRYAEGVEVEVFFNPENPSESVLERRVAFQFLLWGAAIGLFYFAYALASGKIA